MTKKIKVAVIGSGSMGKNHLRVLKKLPNVDVIGCYDKKINRSQIDKDLFFFKSIQDVIKNRPDAVNICTPASSHEEICEVFLKNNIHCFVEKPFGTNIKKCKEIIKIAKKKRKILMVGHIERFNPAVTQLKKLIKHFKPNIIEFKRLNSVSKRIKDVDLISDLMIHDIDIMNFLLNKKIVEIQSYKTGKTKLLDHVIVLFKFIDNTLCMLSASKITKKPVRTIHITSKNAFIELDYSDQTINIFHKTKSLDNIKENLVDEFGNYNLEIAIEKPFIRRDEPLFLELSHFIKCIQGQEKPLISPEEALRAIEIANEISMQLK